MTGPQDDGPWNLDPDDPDDRPARGCLLAIVLGLVFWVLLILLVVIAWRLT